MGLTSIYETYPPFVSSSGRLLINVFNKDTLRLCLFEIVGINDDFTFKMILIG